MKTALITGASNGIGLELAKIHAATGGNLVLVARNSERLNALKNELESIYDIQVRILVKDLTTSNAVTDIYEQLVESSIRIDYLINNAGYGDFGLFSEADWNKTAQMIDLNVKALVHLTRLILPDMITRKEGRILNVASVAGFQPGPLMAAYYATKAFVLSFSQALAYELKGSGICLTVLCPGPTASGFKQAASLENSKLFSGKKIATSLEVAQVGYQAMLKGKTLVIHPKAYSLMLFVERFIPRKWVVAIISKIQAADQTTPTI
jgi:uncharacterized protein